jgi:acyl carrier protein
VIAELGTSPTPSELRLHLEEIVPEYMIPSTILFTNEFPVTPNGKLDRVRLSRDHTTVLGAETEFVPPRTRYEKKLAAIWRETLGVDRVGIRDNFFDLGGHSLLITQIVSRIRDSLGIEVPMRAFFDAPTIEELARIVASGDPTSSGPSRVPDIINRLEEFSEEELAQILRDH